MSEYDRRERAASCLCQRQPGDSPSEATLGDIREQALSLLAKPYSDLSAAGSARAWARWKITTTVAATTATPIVTIAR